MTKIKCLRRFCNRFCLTEQQTANMNADAIFLFCRIITFPRAFCIALLSWFTSVYSFKQELNRAFLFIVFETDVGDEKVGER